MYFGATSKPLHGFEICWRIHPIVALINYFQFEKLTVKQKIKIQINLRMEIFK